MQKLNENKKANAALIVVVLAAVVILAVAVVGGGAWAYVKFVKDDNSTNSTSNQTLSMVGVDGNIEADVCKYAGQLVKGNLNSYAQFTGSAVDPTFKVWKEKPDGWGNPRESFVYDSDNPYATYSSSSGTAQLQEDPADASFYVMATLSGYDTQFFEIDNVDGIIPCETEDDSLTDYNQAPRTKKLYFTPESSLTLANVSLAIAANGTDKEITKYAYLATEDDKGVAIWKVTLQDTLGFRTDADNDNTYDEGVKIVKIKVGDENEVTVFDPAKGINLFDSSTGKYDIEIKASDYESSDFIMDGESIPIKVYVKANVFYNSNSTVTVSADDELLGVGETMAKMSILSGLATDLGDVYIKGSS